MRAGFAKADITPPLGIQLTGYGDAFRPAEEILDPLNATVMVVEQNGVKAAIIGLDWCFICDVISDLIRDAISKAVGIEPLNIQLSCSHTHSAPHTRTRKTIGHGGNNIEEGMQYVKSVLPSIVEAVRNANDSMTEIEVGFAVTESLTGVCRRRVNKDGIVDGFSAAPDLPFDPTMTVAHFRNAETCENIGILIHYGAHNTAMGITRHVTRDWCGVMKDRIESQLKAPVLFLNGSEGDVGPRTNFFIQNFKHLSAGIGDGVDSIREVGYRAATDAIRALMSIKEYRRDLNLKVKTFPIELPYKPLMPLEEAKAVLENTKEEDRKGIPYRNASAVADAWNHPVKKGLQYKQTIIAIGPLAAVPLPGEIFTSISLRTRAESPFQYTLLCSQSNGTNAYLTDRQAVALGGYEVNTRVMFGPYIFVDNIDDVLVSGCLENLNRL